MDREMLLQRIATDPNVCFGKPCIRGHRVWVSLVLDLLADGLDVEAVLRDFPGIERDDVLACIAFAAELARERTIHSRDAA